MEEVKESEYKEQCIAAATQMLVDAEEGELVSFTASAVLKNGKHTTYGSGTDNRFSDAGHMLYSLLRRLGFVVHDDLSDYIRKDEP